jgi:hypothetical protein
MTQESKVLILKVPKTIKVVIGNEQFSRKCESLEKYIDKHRLYSYRSWLF